jgi:hypothetical protein
MTRAERGGLLVDPFQEGADPTEEHNHQRKLPAMKMAIWHIVLERLGFHRTHVS